MKFKAIFLTLLIPVISASSADATRYPLSIGPSGKEVRRDIVDMGFECTRIKGSKFTCTSKKERLTINVFLLSGSYPSSGQVSSLRITSQVPSGRAWLARFLEWYSPTETEYDGINVASWIYQSCLKNETSHLGGDLEIWGKNYYIEGGQKSCTLRIQGNFKYPERSR